jgi:ComEC/Rec2-related protein
MQITAFCLGINESERLSPGEVKGEAKPQGRPPMMKSPLLTVAVCFALGVWIAHAPVFTSPLPVEVISVLIGGSAAMLGFGLANLWWHWRGGAGGRDGAPWLATLLMLAGFVGAGASASRLFDVRFPREHVSHLESSGVDVSKPLDVAGYVLTRPRRTSYGLGFDLEVVSARLHAAGNIEAGDRRVCGKIRLTLLVPGTVEGQSAAEALDLAPGDLVRAPVELRRPSVYRNPGSFDFRQWMESIEDIYWLGTIRDPSTVLKMRVQRESIGGRAQAVITRSVDRARTRLLHTIDQLYPPWLQEGRDGAVLKAVLLGDRSSLDSDTIDNFRRAGLYHLLVIAGLHVGLLALLMEALLRLFRLRRTLRSVLLLIFLLTYALLVEQRAPTLRATLMVTVYLVSRLLYREHTALNSIGIAALLLLMRRPAWLFESGFELSFSAALLITGLAVPILERTTEPYRRALWQIQQVELDFALEPRAARFRLDMRGSIAWLKGRFSPLQRHPGAAHFAVIAPVRLVLWAVNMLLFSAILQIGLLLPMAETFHRVTFLGIALNALAIPVMTVLLAVAVPTIVLRAIWLPVASAPAKMLALIMRGLFLLTDLPPEPRWLSYRIPDPPVWLAVAFVLTLAMAGCALTLRSRFSIAPLALSAGLAVLIAVDPFLPQTEPHAMEVTALDCGGGAAALVVTPDQKMILVNACGSFNRANRARPSVRRRWDPGEEIVSPYLWSRRIKHVDVVVMSGVNQNQLAGMSAILQNFAVRELWYPGRPFANYNPAFGELIETAARGHVVTRAPPASGSFGLGEGSVSIEPGLIQIRNTKGTVALPFGGEENGRGGSAKRAAGNDIAEIISGSSSTPIRGDADPILLVTGYSGRSDETTWHGIPKTHIFGVENCGATTVVIQNGQVRVRTTIARQDRLTLTQEASQMRE